MRVNGQPRTSILTTPDGQYPPRLRQESAEQRTRRAQADVGEGAELSAAERNGGPQNDNPETRGLAERCIVGAPRAPPMFDGLYNYNFQFQMGKDVVAIGIEMIHDVRVVRLNSKHRTDGVRPWFGDSIGWWDGDTLVVETTNIPEARPIRALGKT